MPRLFMLKTLPLTLTLVASIIFLASCGGSDHAQVRVVNAIPDASALLDVYINGTTNRLATGLAFRTVQPGPPAYTSTSSGSSTIEAFPSGQTSSPVVQGTGSLGSGSQYTVLLEGFAAQNLPIAFIPDNNTAPATGNVEFRIINASPSYPGGSMDVYIVPPGSDITNISPQIAGLGFGQASTYFSTAFAASGYTVITTPNGNKNSVVNQTYTTPTGSITTLVVLDEPGGGVVSQIPLELNDLN